MCKEYWPGLLFLSKTKSTEKEMHNLAKKLRLPHSGFTLAVGTAGGCLSSMEKE